MKNQIFVYWGALLVILFFSLQRADAQKVSFSEPKFGDPFGSSSLGYKGAVKDGYIYYAIENSDLVFSHTHSFPDTINIKNVEIKLIDAEKESEIKTVYNSNTFSLLDIVVSSLSVGRYKLRAKISTSTKVGKKDSTYVFTDTNVFDIQKAPSASFKVSNTIKTIKGFTIDYYSHSGGFEKGWTLTIDGKSPDDLNNPGKTPIEKNCKLAIVNECLGTQWFYKEMNAKVIIYPDPVIPTANSSSFIQCLSSEVVILSVSEGEGSMGSWKYQWYDNGNRIKDATNVELSFRASPTWIEGYKKEIDSHKVELEYTFTLETGESLIKNTIPFIINIYKEPTEPSRLVLKGNGTSHTYIALFEFLSDNDLQNYDFAFIFGENEQVYETQNRYLSFRLAPTDPWVQTMWIYDDGYKTYSSVRFMDEGSRSLTEISAIASDEIRIILEGLNYEINGGWNCTIQICSAEGKILKQEHVSSELGYIVGTLDIEGLSEGIYIVNFACADILKTSKIYIH